jgi:uncharacterized protein (TIGR03437 family)
MRSPSLLIGLLLAAGAEAQLSSNAYRVLGQPNLSLNGLNMVQGTELYDPTGLAIDTRNGATHIYIADAGNARVMGWADTASYQIGDLPAVVLGQSGPQFTNGIGNRGFNPQVGPFGMAIDPGSANLYVADPGNNRILRFPSPFSNLTNFTPDTVLGQPDFTTNGTGNSSSALNSPQALTFDGSGNLWVADTGNNRVIRYSASVLDGRSAPQADIVVGQKDFGFNSPNAGIALGCSGLNNPKGVALDRQGNLYVSDYKNLRVLRFPVPVTTNKTADMVLGQDNCTQALVHTPPTSSSMATPTGLVVTNDGTLYVSDPFDNRVLVFPSFTPPALTAYGQATLITGSANLSTTPLASQNGLWNPTDVKLDAAGNVYIADFSNNRVLMYAPGSRSASKVWGQSNFTGNGKNQTKPTSIDTPFRMAIDYSKAPFPLYVSDSSNNRVLIWRDSAHFKTGDPADLVIGQPDLVTAIANVDTASQTPTATSLALPRGIALDASGNLYVADFGNNRVLRYPRPVDQAGRITPDIVLGQSTFTTGSAGLVSASSLNGPSGVAVGPQGKVFISDSGNNRVLQFLPNPVTGGSAILAYGQADLKSGNTQGVSPQTLTDPVGIFVDKNSSLYVVDNGANRVLVFQNAENNQGSGASANLVFGQASFSANASGGGASGLNSPVDVAIDNNFNVIVSDFGNNRVVIYPSLAQPVGTPALYALGGANQNGLATPSSLINPEGLFVDRKNTLYVGDTGNNRVVNFLNASVIANAAGFVLFANGGVPVAPGSLATLKVTPNCVSLSLPCVAPGQSATAPSAPLPPSLAGWLVAVNDTSTAPLYFVGPDSTGVGQVNLQVPGATPSGSNRIAVKDATTGELIAGGSFSVNSIGPGLFANNAQGTGQGAILNQDGITKNDTAHAAPRGSVVSLFGTGPGPVSPPVADGQPPATLTYTITTPAADVQSCLAQSAICAVFGTGVFGTVQFSGLAPGFVGLWQINVQIPSGAPTGAAVPVHVVLGGSPSNTVTMAIQ